VTLDRTLTTDDESVETTALAGTLPLGADRRVELRVIVDRSVVEVFANGRALTGRIYPDVEGAEHYRLEVQDGTASVRSVQAWSMSEIWSQPRSRWP
jgi:beta-fructofuranosidase